MNKAIAEIIKERLIQLAQHNLLPEKVEDFDARLLIPTLTGVSYTVSSVLVCLNKQHRVSEYTLLLEREYDVVNHMLLIKQQFLSLGLEIESMGNFQFKMSTDKGYVLYTIAPTKDKQENIVNNQN